MDMLWHQAPNLKLLAISDQPLPRTKNTISLTNISDEELLSYYKKASFVVLPFGNLVASNAMLEAMACGMPIVCPDSGSARFYLGENMSTTYEPGNPIALAEKIYWLYSNDKERRRLSSQMRERAQLFSWQKVCKLIRGFYDEVLDSKVG
jgi:glycosyltransferase involved in cell wall biosynthesis